MREGFGVDGVDLTGRVQAMNDLGEGCGKTLVFMFVGVLLLFLGMEHNSRQERAMMFLMETLRTAGKQARNIQRLAEDAGTASFPDMRAALEEIREEAAKLEDTVFIVED